MFYYASKLVWIVLTPSNFLITLTLIGAALCATRFAKAGRRLAFTSALLLLIAGVSPLSTLVMAPLENRFPDWRASPHQPPDGIIVLGGSVDANVSFHRRFPLELTEAGDRILAMIELARAYPQTRLVFTGGVGELVGNAGVEADEVRKKIGAAGLDPSRIIFERESRTTYENAIFTRDIVRPKPGERWLLVTSAAHMPRSVGCFRAAGFTIEAYPVDFRTSPGDWYFPSFEASAGLRRLDVATREWIGLIAYRLSSRTDALFPAP